MAKILNYGSLNLDYVYQVPHFVAPGETLQSHSRQVNCGGKGLNQSIAAARAGAAVFQAGKVGPDGVILIDALKENGVDVSLLCCGTEPTGHAIIQVDDNGQNCIILYGGCNQTIRSDEVDNVLSHFCEGDYLMLQNEINNLDYIVRQAAALKMKIVLNPSPIDRFLARLPIDEIYLMVFNEVEGVALSGAVGENEILNVLRARYPRCRLLLTLGSRGCVYDDGTVRITQPCFKVSAVDTTAAGDTFTGYFVAAIASGTPVKDALEFASKAAAIAVTRAGAASSIPSAKEVAEYSI